MVKIDLYNELVKASQEYLGPAGERFIRRQIITHLGKEPEKIISSDINTLVDWVRPTFALLTDDAEHIHSYIGRLQALSDKKSRHGSH